MITLQYDEINWKRETPRILKAEANFMKGYNCCQSVFAAFAPDFGLTEEFALKLSCSLGAGMGRMREVCGAVSAMSLIISLCNGNTNPTDTATKTENYRTVRMLADLFRQKRGSIVCRELLGLKKEQKEEARPNERTSAYYASRPCPHVVRDAAVILEYYLDKR